jgi:hypothetical protein
MGMTECVYLSVCLQDNFRQTWNFEQGFWLPYMKWPISGQVRKWTKSDDPFRVNGQRSYTYEVRIPSCDVSLERSCQELSNDIQLMDPVTVIWPAGTFLRSTKYPIMWGVVGKVLSRAFQRCMTYAPCERFQNVDTKSLPNVHKTLTTFKCRRHSVYKTLLIGQRNGSAPWLHPFERFISVAL